MFHEGLFIVAFIIALFMVEDNFVSITKLIFHMISQQSS